MKRRRHLLARLDRLIPQTFGGGILYIDDVESGAVRPEDLPTDGAGYALLRRPCQTVKEWALKYSGIRYPVQGQA